MVSLLIQLFLRNGDNIMWDGVVIIVRIVGQLHELDQLDE